MNKSTKARGLMCASWVAFKSLIPFFFEQKKGGPKKKKNVKHWTLRHFFFFYGTHPIVESILYFPCCVRAAEQ